MKTTSLVLLLTFLGFSTNPLTQDIKEGKIKIDLPNTEWSLANKVEKENLVVYQYKRTPIEDDQQRKIIPNIAVIVEDISNDIDATTYSAMKRLKIPFDVDDVFIHDSGKIDFKNAIGYKGHYTDNMELEHTVYVVHAINNQKGIQVIMDATSDVMEKVDSEFLLSLKSIRG